MIVDDVEQLLREALVDRAERAPDQTPLLPRFRVLHRRRRRQRYAAGVSGAAVLAAAVVMTPQLFGDGGPLSPARNTGNVQPAAPVETSPTPAPTLVNRTGLGLHPGPMKVAEMPFVPGRVLFGVRKPQVLLLAGQPTLLYQVADINVTVTASDSEPKEPQKNGKHITSNGRRYTYTSGEPGQDEANEQWRLRWRDASGPWVTITGDSPLNNLDEVITYADALASGSTPVEVPFTFDYVPGELVLDDVFSSSVVFRPADVTASEDFVDKLVVSLDSDTADADAGRASSGVPEITRNEDGAQVKLSLGDGTAVTLQVADKIIATDQELRQFVEGIGVTDIATVGQG